MLQGTIASEEEDLPVAVEETFSGNYVVVFDPLDGSSNIDAGISTGSIFGIYDPNDECSLEVSRAYTSAVHLSDCQFPQVVEPEEYGCLKVAIYRTKSWTQECVIAALHRRPLKTPPHTMIHALTQDMDDPEQMMKNCVLNVCQPGAPPIPSLWLHSCSTRAVCMQQGARPFHTLHTRGQAHSEQNITCLPLRPCSAVRLFFHADDVPFVIIT